MGAGHDHEGLGQEDRGHGSSGHDHTAGANAHSLTIALALTGTFLVAELVGAWLFNSLALLSDAAHMFTDAAALAIALAAIRTSQRPADKKRTYGYRRFEILAAAFNALLLFAVAAFVLYERIQRFMSPQPVQSLGMLGVATAGLLVNLVAMRVLVGGKDDSLNVKGAYLEVWADMLGSLGVIGAAILIGLWVACMIYIFGRLQEMTRTSLPMSSSPKAQRANWSAVTLQQCFEIATGSSIRPYRSKPRGINVRIHNTPNPT